MAKKIQRYLRSRIPPQYLDEFLRRQAAFIKKRVRLFCLSAVGIYLLATILGIMMAPEEFRPQEAVLWAVLFAVTAAILFFNKKFHTLAAAKFNAYLFTVAILLILTNINIIYYEYAVYSSSLYVFVLFMVSLIIPWIPQEVVLVTLMHLAAYTAYFLYIGRMALQKEMEISFGLSQYYDGLVFLAMAFVLCVIIRHKETVRDIENFLLLKEIEEKNEKMQKELELATRIHKTLIPKSISTDLADIAVMYLPIRFIGGDYARFHFVAEKKLIFIISDITGHGVSAALLVNRLHTEFERLAKNGKSPGALLKELDEFIKGDFRDTHMYLSAFCGLLDFGKKEFSYSSYGHPPQYIYRVTKSEICPLDSLTSLLGLPTEDEKTYQHSIDFEKRDKILLFTDGVIETTNGKGEEFGTSRLEDFIKENRILPVNDFNRKLLNTLEAYKGGEFKDDISVLSIEIK